MSTTTHMLSIDLDPKRRPALKRAAELYGDAVAYRVQTHGRHRSDVIITTGDYGYGCDLAAAAVNAGAVSVRWITTVATESAEQPGAFRYRTTRDALVTTEQEAIEA